MENASRRKHRLLLSVLILTPILVLALLRLSFRVCKFTGGSMLPSIQDGDIILFQTWGYTPRQGDIVLLEKPGFPPPPLRAAPIIKRVIAVGGQHVQVDYDSGTVYVDSVALEEPYLLEPMVEFHNPSMNILDITIPEGSVYVMGDNRNNSSDSRHEALGCVPVEYILGKAVFH